MIRLFACDILVVLIFAASSFAQETVQREQRFDRDPQWEGVNNRITRDRYPTITQDFGFSSTNFAGQEAGEIGGQIWRSARPAGYGAQIEQGAGDQRLSGHGR